jgi:hypothetical protein
MLFELGFPKNDSGTHLTTEVTAHCSIDRDFAEYVKTAKQVLIMEDL